MSGGTTSGTAAMTRAGTGRDPPGGWLGELPQHSNTVDVDGDPRAGQARPGPWIWYETPPTSTARESARRYLRAGCSIPRSRPPSPTRSSPPGVARHGCPERLPRRRPPSPSTTTNAPCTTGAHGDADSRHWFQPLLDQDYAFFFPAPPKPAGNVLMVCEHRDHCSEIPSSPGNPPGTRPALARPPQRMFGESRTLARPATGTPTSAT